MHNPPEHVEYEEYDIVDIYHEDDQVIYYDVEGDQHVVLDDYNDR